MTVYLVGAGPGDPGLITVRGAELLARADVVVHDRLVDLSLLDLAPASATRIDVGKVPGTPKSQDEISKLLIDLAAIHETVIRLKGGDPFLFGRGGEEVETLKAAGVNVEVVPGITSAFAAPAYAGIPVTHRGLSTSVTVVTGHVGDTTAQGGVDWEAFARAGGTLVILMGIATRAEIARRLIAGGRAHDTPVVAVVWATTASQRTVRTTLAELGTVELESPATIVVGAVAGLDLSWITSRPLAGWTVVVTRPRSKASVLAASLLTAGASVVSLPTVATVGPEDGGVALANALARADDYEWIAFTSSRGVSGFLDAVPDTRVLARAKLAVVGSATAAALAEGHLVADLIARVASAQGLVDAIGLPVASSTKGAAGGRVLFCRAEDALPILSDGLRSAGWQVDEVVTYRTVVAGPEDGADENTLGRAEAAHAVVFASPSAVRGFLELMRGRRRAPLAVCIGETTASAARDAGFDVAAIATVAGAEGLLSAVIEARHGSA